MKGCVCMVSERPKEPSNSSLEITLVELCGVEWSCVGGLVVVRCGV